MRFFFYFWKEYFRIFKINSIEFLKMIKLRNIFSRNSEIDNLNNSYNSKMNIESRNFELWKDDNSNFF